MSWKTSLLAVVAAFGIGLLTACNVLSPETSFAPSHPDGLGAGRPICSDCHTNESMKGGFRTSAIARLSQRDVTGGRRLRSC